MKRSRPEIDIETARCATCGIFTPTTDVVFGPRGVAHCVPCGVPSTSYASTSSTAYAIDDAFEIAFRSPPLDRAARLVAAAMLATLASFWLAAFASQL